MVAEQLAAVAGIIATVAVLAGIISVKMQRLIIAALSFGVAIYVGFVYLILPLFAI